VLLVLEHNDQNLKFIHTQCLQLHRFITDENVIILPTERLVLSEKIQLIIGSLAACNSSVIWLEQLNALLTKLEISINIASFHALKRCVDKIKLLKSRWLQEQQVVALHDVTTLLNALHNRQVYLCEQDLQHGNYKHIATSLKLGHLSIFEATEALTAIHQCRSGLTLKHLNSHQSLRHTA
jgi:hypothetical protein